LSRSRIISFVTGNRHKFEEAQTVLSEYGLKLRMVDEKTLEVQSDRLEEIASESARDAKRRIKGSIIVEDAGLFIYSLKGFPGPYSSYTYRTLGCGGILKILEGSEDREAEFRSAVAYIDDEMAPDVKVSVGVVKGRIAHSIRGWRGFGFDPIFIPEGWERTFGEVDLEWKNKSSHRARSLRIFASWYLKADPTIG